jgi:NAD-dependent deacetylase
MKHIVVFTGAGISAESGLKTFRDADGLWENHSIEEVATPEAFHANPELVLRFYNERRKQLLECSSNDAHIAIAELESKYKVTVITQNVDDLHERAGSTNVVHLHGELMKVRSTAHPELVYTLQDWELKWGDHCEKGFQLRPHIVWFGEQVPMMDKAIEIVEQADVFLVVGTSLQVYPAAGLVHYASKAKQKFLIDPKSELPYGANDFTLVRSTATDGVRKVLEGI